MSLRLKEIHLFEGIDAECINMIVDNSRRVNYIEGDVVIKQGDESNGSAYIIQEGDVKIEINGNQVATLNEGSIFGEIALITDEPRVASVIACNNLVLLKIEKELLHTIIKKFKNGPEIQKTLLERISSNLKG